MGVFALYFIKNILDLGFSVLLIMRTDDLGIGRSRSWFFNGSGFLILQHLEYEFKVLMSEFNSYFFRQKSNSLRCTCPHLLKRVLHRHYQPVQEMVDVGDDVIRVFYDKGKADYHSRCLDFNVGVLAFQPIGNYGKNQRQSRCIDKMLEFSAH